MKDKVLYKFSDTESDEVLPVWVAEWDEQDYHEYDVPLECCEAQQEGDPCVLPMYRASVEDDIALSFCSHHVFDNLTPVTPDEYAVLVAGME